jgi:hypothetical protein
MRALLKTCGTVVLAALAVLAAVTEIGAQVAAPPTPSNPVPAPSQSQKPTTTSPKPCALPGISPEQLHEVVDASSVLQPPLAADAMIRIAAKVTAQCPALAKDLLQRAFDQAEAVEPPTAFKIGTGMGRMNIVIGSGTDAFRGTGYSTDSRFAFTEKTYALAMDSLSLRSRAVLRMVPVDGNKAIQLFQQIAPPRPPVATCSSGFAPDVEIYYEALEKIFALWKARKPRSDTEAQAPFQELEEVTSATTSPVQLAPLVKVFEGANLPPGELSPLLNALAAAVGNFPVDDNSFCYREKYPAVKAKDQLVRLARAKQISPAAFLRSFYDFLDRSLNGSHCDGNEPKDVRELGILYRSFTHLPGTPEQQPETLNLPDSLPPVEPSPDAGEYWQSLKDKQLLLDAKHVNFDDNWRPYTDADRKTPEWQDRVRHLLDDMDNWNASDEPDASTYYHEREILIYRVLADIPPGTLYDRVISAWVKTFAESSLQWDNPAEWYIGVSDFLRYSKKNVDGPASAAAIAPLKDSSNPYLNSIGTLAEFLQ